MPYSDMPPTFVDSHAHLFYEDYSQDLEAVLDRARDHGITRVIIPGTREDTCRQALELASRHKGLYAAVGIHPHESAKVTSEEVESVWQLAALTGVVAVGEIGLDHFYDFAPKDVQAELFQRQLTWATELNLPVIVHTRDSMDDAIRIVEEHARVHPEWGRREDGSHRGVFHCFTGTPDEAQRLFNCGFYISFPGIVTFKKHVAPETLKEIGLNRVLVETDSPYLTPVPHRGKRNEPAYVALIGAAIAALLGVSVEEVAAQTTRNAEILFRLPRFV